MEGEGNKRLKKTTNLSNFLVAAHKIINALVGASDSKTLGRKRLRLRRL